MLISDTINTGGDEMNQLCFDDLLPKQQRKQPVKVLKLFELFAGYGSQSLALKRFNIPFEAVGYCEIDKYAIQAYKALHGDHIKNYGDITKVNVDELPNMNLLTYSFPCQDISVAGKQRGLSKDSGTRSSLLWECHRIIEAKRPEYLMMENVKNLVGKQNMPDFQAWLDTLTLLGYNNYWKVVNAKHCGVPQNRERVFCVSIRQDIDDGLFRFEEPFDNGIRLKDILEREVDEKYYIDEEKTKELIKVLKFSKKLKEPIENSTIYSGMSLNENFSRGNLPNYSRTLKANLHDVAVFVKEATKQGYAIAEEGDSINLEHPNSKTRRGRVGVGVAQTLTTSCNQAVIEPFKPELIGGVGEINFGKQYRQGNRVYDSEAIAMCLLAQPVGNAGGNSYLYEVDYRIRKLTPRECFRLMGLSVHEIEKIQSINISNSQQYKMAGNSIVVDAMEFLKNINGGYE